MYVYIQYILYAIFIDDDNYMRYVDENAYMNIFNYICIYEYSIQ